MSENSDTFQILICLSFYTTGGEVKLYLEIKRSVFGKELVEFFLPFENSRLENYYFIKEFFFNFLCHK
jgi:hypothetical protein